MIIASGGYHSPQQGTIEMHATNHGAAEQQKLEVFVGCATGVEQVALGGVTN